MKLAKPFSKELASRRLLRNCTMVNNDLFNMTIWWCRIGKDSTKIIDAHRHFFYEIHYILDGNCDIYANEDNCVHLSKNEFTIIPPSVMHKICSDDSLYKFVFGFEVIFHNEHPDCEKFQTLFDNLSCINSYKGNRHIVHLINNLLETAYYYKIGYHLALSSYIQLFLIEIASIISEQMDFDFEDHNFINDSSIPVESIMKVLKDNENVNLSSTDIANMFNISSRQLNRILVKSTGKTTYQLIREAKIMRIKKLLLETELSLQDIANQLGYSSEYSLSRFFKCEVGWTPAAFRKSKK